MAAGPQHIVWVVSDGRIGRDWALGRALHSACAADCSLHAVDFAQRRVISVAECPLVSQRSAAC